MSLLRPMSIDCVNSSKVEVHGDIPQDTKHRRNPSIPTVEKNLPFYENQMIWASHLWQMTSKYFTKLNVSFMLTKASLNNWFAITLGLTKLDDWEISFVSSSFDNSSFAKPGVSVSGGKQRVTEILCGVSSMAKLSAKPRSANLTLL